MFPKVGRKPTSPPFKFFWHNATLSKIFFSHTIWFLAPFWLSAGTKSFASIGKLVRFLWHTATSRKIFLIRGKHFSIFFKFLVFLRFSERKTPSGVQKMTSLIYVFFRHSATSKTIQFGQGVHFCKCFRLEKSVLRGQSPVSNTMRFTREKNVRKIVFKNWVFVFPVGEKVAFESYAYSLVYFSALRKLIKFHQECPLHG